MRGPYPLRPGPLAVPPRVCARPPGQFGDVGLDGILRFRQALETVLLSAVDLGLLHAVVSANDQVEPDKQL
jgi:hypothetical protein